MCIKTKHLSLILLLILGVLLVSCNTTTEPPESTDESTVTTEQVETTEPTPTKKTVDDLRQTVLDYMVLSSSIEWKPREDMDFSHDTAFTAQTIYKAGETYHGVIYSPKRTSTYVFVKSLTADGYYTGGTDWATALGTTCSTSIFAAWKLVSNSFNCSATQEMIPNEKNGICPVGEYNLDALKTYTGDITTATGKDAMFAAYSLVKPGDAILAAWPKDESKGHIRMISQEPEIVLLGNGKIAGPRSFLYTTEQSSSMYDMGSYKTTWKVNGKYSFDEIFAGYYIPVTIKEFATGEFEDSVITFEGGNNARNVVAGVKGVVTSNYFINTVEIEITDESGKVVMSKTCVPDGFTCDIADSTFKLTSLEAGNYHITVTVKTGMEERKVMDFDFERKAA